MLGYVSRSTLDIKIISVRRTLCLTFVYAQNFAMCLKSRLHNRGTDQMHGKNSEAREKVYFNWIYHLSAISLSLQLYLNTELFHNIKLTKYIQRENKMSA